MSDSPPSPVPAESPAKRCPHFEPSLPECEPCHIRRLSEDRDAAISLLRLFVKDHAYIECCHGNGGLACYKCRTVEWLRAHAGGEKFPVPEATP